MGDAEQEMLAKAAELGSSDRYSDRHSDRSFGAAESMAAGHYGSTVDKAENRWAWRLVFRLKGSVFPRAMVVAVPSVIVAIGLRLIIDHYGWKREELGGNQIWAGYNSALGFLIIFRTQKAYSRWWEGGSLLLQVRGEWYNAASSLIAFCSGDEGRRSEIRDFQHLMVLI